MFASIEQSRLWKWCQEEGNHERRHVFCIVIFDTRKPFDDLKAKILDLWIWLATVNISNHCLLREVHQTWLVFQAISMILLGSSFCPSWTVLAHLSRSWLLILADRYCSFIKHFVSAFIAFLFVSNVRLDVLAVVLFAEVLVTFIHQLPATTVFALLLLTAEHISKKIIASSSSSKWMHLLSATTVTTETDDGTHSY